jgi:hypothetical protein
MSILDELSAFMETGRTDVARFLYSAPARYRVFSIKKRNGDDRQIAQPSATLKIMQRFVLDQKLAPLPVHAAASAYASGKSIRHNAEVHRSAKFILKLDFEQFFPSLTVRDWRNYVRSKQPAGIEEADGIHYERLLFWGGGGFTPEKLSIGAPTSPTISNILMYEFDSEVSRYAADVGASYTRYADDVTFSSDSHKDLVRLETLTTQYVKKLRSPKLTFNATKRGLYGPGEKKMVTGLLLTPTGGVSIGRDRKRLISAMMHRAVKGELDILQIGHLKGLLGFAVAAEPDFLARLRAKYGNAAVDQVMKTHLPPRLRQS